MIVLHKPLAAAWLLLCLLALAACVSADYYASFSALPTPPTQVPGEEVPFTSVFQGATGASRNCDAPTEVASLATTAEEYADILALVSQPPPYQNLPNWESIGIGANEALINIWRGCGDGCELDITTRTISRTDEHALSIVAEMRRWRPDQACNANNAFFAQLIRIPWDGTPASEAKLHLVLFPVYR